MSTSHPSLSFPHSHIIYWKGNFLAVEQGVNKDQMLPSLMKERGFLYQLWYVPVKKKKTHWCGCYSEVLVFSRWKVNIWPAGKFAYGKPLEAVFSNRGLVTLGRLVAPWCFWLTLCRATCEGCFGGCTVLTVTPALPQVLSLSAWFLVILGKHELMLQTAFSPVLPCAAELGGVVPHICEEHAVGFLTSWAEDVGWWGDNRRETGCWKRDVFCFRRWSGRGESRAVRSWDEARGVEPIRASKAVD